MDHKLGDKVSVWVEGEIEKVEKCGIFDPSGQGVKVTIINKKNGAICIVPPLSIEPRGPEVQPTIQELLEEEHEVRL